MPISTLSSELYDVIARRRDVRAEFSGEPIDAESLGRVLHAAHSAPSVGHTQPWDFILVRDPGTHQAFRDHVQTERETFDASLPADRQQTFSKIKVEGIMESGLGVVVTYDASRGGEHVLGRHAIADAGLYSTCLAIQNLWLAATAEGLGVGWLPRQRAGALLKRGELVEKQTADPREPNILYVAWRGEHEGRALEWWLEQLRQPRLSKRLVQGLDAFGT